MQGTERTKLSGDDMEQKLSKQDVEAQLRGRSESIERRIDVLQDEVTTLRQAIQSSVLNHPLVSLGGALGAGLLVGWLFSGKSRRGDLLRDTHGELLDRYVRLLADDVREAVAQGTAPDDAVRYAMRDRAPLIILEQESTEKSSGFLGGIANIISSTVFHLVSRLGVEFAMGALEQRVPQRATGDGEASTAPEMVNH